MAILPWAKATLVPHISQLQRRLLDQEQCEPLLPKNGSNGSVGRTTWRLWKTSSGSVSNKHSSQVQESSIQFLDPDFATSDRQLTNTLSSNRSARADGSSNGAGDAGPLESATPPASLLKSWRAVLWAAWLLNKGPILVLVAEFLAAAINVMARILETEINGMHPLHVIIIRMFIMSGAGWCYALYAKVPSPFGSRGILLLLITRSVSGFFGVFGLYYSLMYLPLSEATVLTFLVPILTCYACSFLIPNEPFTRKEQVAAIISLLGVVLIARPFSALRLGSDSPASVASELAPPKGADLGLLTRTVDSYHHTLGLIVALIGVLGTTCAYTSIRWIGQRAHPLVLVNFYSTTTLLLSVLLVCTMPSLSFQLPETLLEWTFLVTIGLAGLVMQYLLTAGLAYVPERVGQPSSSSGSRATSMLFTQLLFALFFDKVIWNTWPSGTGWAGSALIFCSTIYISSIYDRNRPANAAALNPGNNENEEIHHNEDHENVDVDVERGSSPGRERSFSYCSADRPAQ